MLDWLRGAFGGRKPGAPAIIIDEQGVRRDLGGGRVESVSWDELREVRIVTTSAGPFVEDVFYLLVGDEGGCAVPSFAAGDLLPRLQSLPGFDNQAVIHAMTCTDDASFVCWRRQPDVMT
jgi:hypothetical protein